MRTIYVTLALALVIMAVLVALSSAWRKTDEGAVESSEDVILDLEDKEAMAPYTEKATTPPETEKADVAPETVTEDTATEKPVAAEPTLPEFVSPVSGTVSKGHSADTPVYSLTMNDYRTHIGIDIAASIGDDVYAAAAGTVKEIWEDPMAGNCMSITHDGGAVSIYRNISPNLPESITVGAKVSAGDVIASVGDTSLVELSDEAHLHFELTIDGVQVDPVKYISIPTSDTGYEG